MNKPNATKLDDSKHNGRSKRSSTKQISVCKNKNKYAITLLKKINTNYIEIDLHKSCITKTSSVWHGLYVYLIDKFEFKMVSNTLSAKDIAKKEKINAVIRISKIIVRIVKMRVRGWERIP